MPETEAVENVKTNGDTPDTQQAASDEVWRKYASIVTACVLLAIRSC